MKNTHIDSPFLTSILIAICVFCILLAFGMFNHMKNSERTLKDKNATLIRERAELKIQFDSLSETFEKNRVSITSIENEKKSIAKEFERLEKEYGELKTRNANTLRILKRENKAIRRKIDAFKKESTAELIKQIASRETDDGIKRILSDTLAKIGAAKDGKYVALDPIIVPVETDTPQDISSDIKLSPDAKQGKVVSVNKKNSLIVINLGRIQGLTEGKRCRVIGNRGEVASGTVIRTRYEISAAFMDTFSSKCTIDDIKEDAKVVID